MSFRVENVQSSGMLVQFSTMPFSKGISSFFPKLRNIPWEGRGVCRLNSINEFAGMMDSVRFSPIKRMPTQRMTGMAQEFPIPW